MDRMVIVAASKKARGIGKPGPLPKAVREKRDLGEAMKQYKAGIMVWATVSLFNPYTGPKGLRALDVLFALLILSLPPPRYEGPSSKQKKMDKRLERKRRAEERRKNQTEKSK